MTLWLFITNNYKRLRILVSELSTTVVEQRSFISWSEHLIASINPGVDVRGDENLDSIPNLIISGAARSNPFINLDAKDK